LHILTGLSLVISIPLQSSGQAKKENYLSFFASGKLITWITLIALAAFAYQSKTLNALPYSVSPGMK
jgi:hypothetical protein